MSIIFLRIPYALIFVFLLLPDFFQLLKFFLINKRVRDSVAPVTEIRRTAALSRYSFETTFVVDLRKWLYLADSVET